MALVAQAGELRTADPFETLGTIQRYAQYFDAEGFR